MHSTRRSTAFAPMAALFSVLAISSASSAQAQAAGRQTVVGEGQRISATLSPGIRVGNLLWASGQLGTSPTDTTIAGQTTRALESTEKVFKAAGTTLAAAATKCTVFLIEGSDFAGMNPQLLQAQKPLRNFCRLRPLIRRPNNHRRWSIEHRNRSLANLDITIHIGNRRSQQTVRLATNLVRRPIVNRQRL